MISRDFLAHRVFDMVKPRLIDRYDTTQIWTAIAETSDDELYKFYRRLVEERGSECRSS